VNLSTGLNRQQIAPKLPRERSAALEPAGISCLAPKSIGHRELAFESVGAKRSAPKQCSSNRPAKRARVRSKM
jgi:hypothetical protein